MGARARLAPSRCSHVLISFYFFSLLYFAGLGVSARKVGEGNEEIRRARIEKIHDDYFTYRPPNGEPTFAGLGGWDAFLGDSHDVGPVHILCARTDGHGGLEEVFDKSYGRFMKEGKHAGLAIRSISKMFVAAAFSRLVESGQANGLTLESELAAHFPGACGASSLANSTIAEMMSVMTPLDNRITALWKVQVDDETDHVGFPNFCDEMGYSPVECVEKVVCPAYTPDPERNTIGTIHPKMAKAVRAHAMWRKCEDLEGSKECQDVVKMKGEGICQALPRVMNHYCQKSCGTCVGEEEALRNLMATEGVPPRGARGWWDTQRVKEEGKRNWPIPSFAISGEEEEGKEDEVSSSDFEAVYYFSDICHYDNYNYALIDAMVIRATGKPLWQWVITLIAEPLGLEDMIRCMDMSGSERKKKKNSKGIEGCYAPPDGEEEQKKALEGKWRLHTGGPESVNWSGISLYASNSDLTKFMAMLTNGGRIAASSDDHHRRASSSTVHEKDAKEETTSMQFIDQDFVNMMIKEGPDGGTYVNAFRGDCHGSEMFSLGMGICAEEKKSSHMCEGNHKYWGWGGTYGTRIVGMWTKNGFDFTTGGGRKWQKASADRHPGLVCATSPNLSSIKIGSDPNSMERLASRQHPLYHEVSANLARLFDRNPRNHNDDPDL